MMVDSLSKYKFPPLREIVKQYSLSTKKKFGQHFLFDDNLTDKIANAAGDLSEGTIIEVGPGPGGLTRSLLKNGAQNLLALEYDKRCIEALDYLKNHFPSELDIIYIDALKFDISTVNKTPIKIVANLPYNISVPLLIEWIKRSSSISKMVLMFQKEVVDRIIAEERTKNYGRLSILTQYFCNVKKLFDISPSSFVPPPKVISTVIEITPRHNQHLVSVSHLETVTSCAFNQRRKKIKTSLKSLADNIETLLLDLKIDPSLRADQISVDNYAAITKKVFPPS